MLCLCLLNFLFYIGRCFSFAKFTALLKILQLLLGLAFNFELSCAGMLRFSNSLIKLFNDVSSFVPTLVYLDPLSLLSLEFVERKIAWWSHI